MAEPAAEPDERLRWRRRFALLLSPLAVAPLAIGVALAGDEGALGVLGLVALGQGIGLLVALVWLGLGRNPLQGLKLAQAGRHE